MNEYDELMSSDPVLDDIDPSQDDPGKLDGKIPLGLCKQVIMKMDSAMADLSEIKEDPDLDEKQLELFQIAIDMVGQIGAIILNVVHQEMGEDEFMSISIPMDSIDVYPGDLGDDIMDIELF